MTLLAHACMLCAWLAWESITLQASLQLAESQARLCTAIAALFVDASMAGGCIKPQWKLARSRPKWSRLE
jgi:hypothetical protein